MNDKIKELAEQCGVIDILANHAQKYAMYQEPLEKFAELIIQECIEACNENNKQVQAHLGVSACVKSIKQRFGITE